MDEPARERVRYAYLEWTTRARWPPRGLPLRAPEMCRDPGRVGWRAGRLTMRALLASLLGGPRIVKLLSTEQIFGPFGRKMRRTCIRTVPGWPRLGQRNWPTGGGRVRCSDTSLSWTRALSSCLGGRTFPKLSRWEYGLLSFRRRRRAYRWLQGWAVRGPDQGVRLFRTLPTR